MEFTKEFIEEQKLSDDQVKGITGITKDHIATLKKGWDTTANDNAERILDGAINDTQTKTGFSLKRDQGEKIGDYFNRFSEGFLSSKQTELEKAKSEYEDKMKDFKGGDAFKEELDKVTEKLDDALKKYADYDTLKEQASKAEEYGQQLSGLKLEVAFNAVKPTFPDTVNKYESKAIWKEFKAEVLLKNTIEIVDGVPTTIDKENIHKTGKLEDLLLKHETIQKLLKGRKQVGTGAIQVDLVDFKDVPFKVPKDADGQMRSKLIAEYLATKGIGSMHTDYSAKFAEINDKILEGKKLEVA